ncbi:hypothetical protein U1Q18_000104 [Sarracenia purpurea var. burkii]
MSRNPPLFGDALSVEEHVLGCMCDLFRSWARTKGKKESSINAQHRWIGIGAFLLCGKVASSAIAAAFDEGIVIGCVDDDAGVDGGSAAGFSAYVPLVCCRYPPLSEDGVQSTRCQPNS